MSQQSQARHSASGAARAAHPRADGGASMFDAIAPRYDRLNRLMSLGLDQGWRRRLVRAIAPAVAAGGEILDLATGTADIALAAARAYPESRVLGIDPSAGMLAVGRQKIIAADLAARVELAVGDAQRLELPTARFAATTIAFGIRNVPDRERALREMARVTRPGGIVAILELTEPTSGWLAAFARAHVHHIVPRLGAWLGDGDGTAYTYLRHSIAVFPPPKLFANQLAKAGLQVTKMVPLGLGSAHLFIATVGP